MISRPADWNLSCKQFRQTPRATRERREDGAEDGAGGNVITFFVAVFFITIRALRIIPSLCLEADIPRSPG